MTVLAAVALAFFVTAWPLGQLVRRWSHRDATPLFLVANLVVRLVAAAVLARAAVAAVEMGGAWLAVAAFVVVIAVFTLFQAGVLVWLLATGHRSDGERPC